MIQFVITAPDWELLRQQKYTLITTVWAKEESDCEITRKEADDLRGILHFIDHIQDAAVESGDWTEEQIFNLTEEE